MIAGHPIVIWLTFAAIVGALCAVDLGIVSRRAHELSFGEAARWSGVVIAAALAFGGLIWWRHGRADAAQFATGYLIELSLSVDNLLVFIIVLQYFDVPAALRPAVLKWGIIGAIVMRGAVIAAGTVLLHQFIWVIYILGGVLIFTGVRLFARQGAPPIRPDHNMIVQTAEHLLPVTDEFAGTAFVAQQAGRRMATPLLLTVLVIEWTDLVFATDSIPAIFAVTRDPFLVYTSNIFAVVGLRALFFLLAGALARFTRLRNGVATILVLVGVKMLASRWVVIPPYVTLLVVVVILGWSLMTSPRLRSASITPR